MNLNEKINTETPTINNLVKKLEEEEYFIDNSFQRRLIWTEKQKIRLIETILMCFPMPEIYVWQERADPESGDRRSSIVDGQQRLNAIRQFIANEFPLKKAALENEHRTEKYAGKLWKQLDDDSKSVIWDYTINVRLLPSDVSKSQIRRVFSRLNETDKSLNPQEYRNAKFVGEFIRTALDVADSKELKAVSVFEDDRKTRRMEDVDFASQLLIYHRRGIVSDTPTAINDMYDQYNDEYKQKAGDKRDVKKNLGIITSIYRHNSGVKGFFSKPLHLYSLYCAVDILQPKQVKKRAAELAAFVDAYERNLKRKLIQSYKVGSSYGTKGKRSREERVYSLVSWLEK